MSQGKMNCVDLSWSTYFQGCITDPVQIQLSRLRYRVYKRSLALIGKTGCFLCSYRINVQIIILLMVEQELPSTARLKINKLR